MNSHNFKTNNNWQNQARLFHDRNELTQLQRFTNRGELAQLEIKMNLCCIRYEVYNQKIAHPIRDPMNSRDFETNIHGRNRELAVS